MGKFWLGCRVDHPQRSICSPSDGFITSSRYQWNQFRARKAEPTHLRVPKSPEGGRPCRPSRSLVPVYKRFYCFRSNRTLLNFSNFDLSRSCRNLIPPYLRRRRSPAAWLQYTSLIIREKCGSEAGRGVSSLPIRKSLRRLRVTPPDAPRPAPSPLKGAPNEKWLNHRHISLDQLYLYICTSTIHALNFTLANSEFHNKMKSNISSG